MITLLKHKNQRISSIKLKRHLPSKSLQFFFHTNAPSQKFSCKSLLNNCINDSKIFHNLYNLNQKNNSIINNQKKCNPFIKLNSIRFRGSKKRNEDKVYIYSKKHNISSQKNPFYDNLNHPFEQISIFYGPSKQDLLESKPHQNSSNFLNQYRCIEPYSEMMLTYFKENQIGKNIKELLNSLFPMVGLSYDYWETAMKKGTVLLSKGNAKEKNTSGGNAFFKYTARGFHRIDPDYKVEQGHGFYHLYHRHEAPITSKPIEILSKDIEKIPGILPIIKPASIPIHPVGPYKYNSLISMLCQEEEICPWTFHRIDRIVSGLVLVGTDSQIARKCADAFLGREVEKKYLAQVDGKFPEKIIANSSIIPGRSNPSERNLEQSPIQNYASISSENGKESKTTFERLSFDNKRNKSLVLCQPHTGRSHQIRLHLQTLGFPICNDILYHPEAFSQVSALEEKNKDIKWTSRKEDRLKNDFLKINQYNRNPLSLDPECHSCQGDPFIYPVENDSIDLHAYRYTLFGKTFTAPPPDWALQSFSW